MGRTIGYARVSTPEQDLSLQLAALRQAGCPDEQIFLDVASGTHTMRPGLEACLQALAAGDLLVVWRLDRLGRSMLHLVTVMTELGRRQVGFRSLCDGALDTTTATGELVFHLFSALAQFERRLIQGGFQPSSDVYVSHPVILLLRTVRPISAGEGGDACMSPMPE